MKAERAAPPQTESDTDARMRLADIDPSAPTLATTAVVVVLCGFLIVESSNVVALSPSGAELGLLAFGVAATFALQLLHCSRTMRRTQRRRWAWVTLPAQAAITYVPLISFGSAWGGIEGFLMASVLLLMRPYVLAWSVYGAIVAATAVVSCTAAGFDADGTLYFTVANGLTGLVIFSITRLADLVADIFAARRDLARLAVERERNRFSRDLHDLLGYSLSAIALKSELAYRLIQQDPEQAQEDIATVLSISRQALVDVRSVARSYREMSLAVQATSAAAMLESAGIEVTVAIAENALPGQLDTVLATTVREGVTNLLRHSKAEHCRISLTCAGGLVELSVVNDGVDTVLAAQCGRTEFGDGRGGLDSLRSRVAMVGGELTAVIDDDGWFRLVATAPLHRPALDQLDDAGELTAGRREG